MVSTALLDELGPALLAEGALFLYGPPGTGKTSIAERLIRIHDDAILVPHAVEVDGQIITVFDPVVHRPLDEQPADLDPRWVRCRRPAITAGGELQRSQLDLTFESSSGVYIAPLQMLANNGVFVIDDFGRQQGLTPETLLNRWIVPLDRRVDYLSLSYGLKFEIPFDVKVVFSTNLAPASLGDEAFFRRIQNKILVPPILDDEFDEVLSAGHRRVRHHRRARRAGAPAADEPRAGRRRPAPVPAPRGVPHPALGVPLPRPARGPRPGQRRPRGVRVLHPHLGPHDGSATRGDRLSRHHDLSRSLISASRNGTRTPAPAAGGSRTPRRTPGGR